MWWLTLALVACAADAAEPSDMGCERRYYVVLASQTDDEGHRCWGHIRIRSCRGRCDSREISDWQFPYKKSHHPVCVHGTRRAARAVLDHCDPGASPSTREFRYMEAKTCKCQTCSSEDTSCEWLPDSTQLEQLFSPEPALDD